MIRADAHKLRLDAPSAFWVTDDATLGMITGGCGPGKFGNFGWFDKMYGLDMRPACSIHDFEYAIGTTLEQKEAADSRMLKNFLRIVNTRSKSFILRILRRYRATSYYNAVAEGGFTSFENATIVGPSPAKQHQAPWYDVAIAEMSANVLEIEGPEHNQKIIDYHKSTDLRAKTDETAWCSSFVNYCMFKAGVSRTHKANARSWLAWGEPIDEPVLGCVVVFKRGVKAWQGHVGFFAGWNGADRVLCLGGNQKNTINISSYSKNKVLGYRWVA